MPYPKPDNPHYCSGSGAAAPGFDPQVIWFRCPQCSRLIAAKPNGTFFPHLDHPTRRKDSVQETLDAFGLNRREPRGEVAYADSEELLDDI